MDKIEIKTICKNGILIDLGLRKEVMYLNYNFASKNLINNIVIIRGLNEFSYKVNMLKCIREVAPFIKGKGTTIKRIYENLRGLYRCELNDNELKIYDVD